MNILHLHTHPAVSERKNQASSMNRTIGATLTLRTLHHHRVKRLLTRARQPMIGVRVWARWVEPVTLRAPARLIILNEQPTVPLLQAVNEPETLTFHALRLPRHRHLQTRNSAPPIRRPLSNIHAARVAVNIQVAAHSLVQPQENSLVPLKVLELLTIQHVHSRLAQRLRVTLTRFKPVKILHHLMEQRAAPLRVIRRLLDSLREHKIAHHPARTAPL